MRLKDDVGLAGDPERPRVRVGRHHCRAVVPMSLRRGFNRNPIPLGCRCRNQTVLTNGDQWTKQQTRNCNEKTHQTLHWTPALLAMVIQSAVSNKLLIFDSNLSRVKNAGEIEHVVEQHYAHQDEVAAQHHQRDAHRWCHCDWAESFARALLFRIIVEGMDYAEVFGRYQLRSGCAPAVSRSVAMPRETAPHLPCCRDRDDDKGWPGFRSAPPNTRPRPGPPG